MRGNSHGPFLEGRVRRKAPRLLDIDLELKAEALALCDIAEQSSSRSWKEKKGIMAFLDSL